MIRDKHSYTISNKLAPDVLHELKTPVSSINGYASILLTNELGPTNQRQNEILMKIVDRCDYLNDMISKLLELSRPSPLTLQKEKINLNEVISANINAIDILAQKKNVKIIVHLPKTAVGLRATQGDFNQILSNLLSNAIKFNKIGGRIDVRLAKKGNTITLSVSDTGAGIPRKELPWIYDKFYNQDIFEPKKEKGTGLGLNIVRKTVKSYKGKIDCKTRLKKGTTFTIKLPIDDKKGG